MLVILELGRLKQEDHEFEASVGGREEGSREQWTGERKGDKWGEGTRWNEYKRKYTPVGWSHQSGSIGDSKNKGRKKYKLHF